MLCDISELSALFAEDSLEELLQKVVDMVADHMRAQVCSIYLYDDHSDMLTLRATRGLKSESVGQVQLRSGEGLVGIAFYEKKSICEASGSSHPNFKFYPNIDEELYDAFLAVPILRGQIGIGVLVVQRRKGDSFTEQDQMALKATSSQLVSMLENIRLLFHSRDRQKPYSFKREEVTSPEFHSYRFMKGRSGSSGVAYAGTIVLGAGNAEKPLFDVSQDSGIDSVKFEEAIVRTERQLDSLQAAVEERLSDAASLIFGSHLLMLKDPSYVGSMRELMRRGVHPVAAVQQIYQQYLAIFEKSEAPMIREKVQDIKDLTTRLMDNLIGSSREEQYIADHILIARELLPSDLLRYSAENVKGVVLVSGGVTSHVSILARSLQLPLVIINDASLLRIPPETPVIVDADSGAIYLHPAADLRTRMLAQEDKKKTMTGTQDLGRCQTRDGRQISIMINVNLISDADVLSSGEIDGVGLYRSEFPFIIRHNFPSEEEQFFIYSRLLKKMRGKPVTFRTLDIGGDKILSYYEFPHQENPFLGMRSLRFSLSHKEIFKQQIRAILRAGANHDIKIMFPMVASLDDIYECKEVLQKCQQELSAEGAAYHHTPPLGAMIEIPSTIPIIDDLANELDFLSIGTNDLIQYTLAVDRTNEKVSDYYIPHHPAILRSLKKIAEAGIKYGKPVSICGDMGAKEQYIPFLIGIGITILSMDSYSVRRSKELVCRLDSEECAHLAEKMLAASTIRQVEASMLEAELIPTLGL